MTKPYFVAFFAVSLDGYLARENGELDWLPAPEVNEDFGFQQLIQSVDALLMGHNTYKVVQKFADQWPYGKLPILVATRAPETVFSMIPSVKPWSWEIEDWPHKLHELGYTKVYVDGGQIIREMLKHDWLDEIVMTRIPVILGKGIPLWGEIPESRWEVDVAVGERKSFLDQTRFVRKKS